MSSLSQEKLLERLRSRLGGALEKINIDLEEVTLEVSKENLIEVCTTLRDDMGLRFEQLIDLCGVDYLDYAQGSWQGPRYAAVYHLLSVKHNVRLRLKVYLDEAEPRVASVTEIWNCANWFEREAFDMFGFLFEGHPDLRRLLTDYGFIGHPFRKDFPLEGHVEMRYDPERQRVVYEPVTVESRINVPRVIRHDNRYETLAKGE